MMEYKVDRIHSRFDRGTNQLILWLFNDDSFYAEKSMKRISRYDFGRTENDRKIKLEKGLYREPYKDGWKYVINTKLHPVLAKTVERYDNHGFTTDEDGKEVPFTYLRHNRKALGIQYLYDKEDAIAASSFFIPYAICPGMVVDRMGGSRVLRT